LRRREAEKLQRLALDDRGERRDLLLRLLVVTALAVDAEEAVEDDAASVRTHHVRTGVDVEARVLEARRGHLRCERALPDERVQLELVRFQVAPQVRRRARQIRGSDRLVRLLRALRPRLVM